MIILMRTSEKQPRGQLRVSWKTITPWCYETKSRRRAALGDARASRPLSFRPASSLNIIHDMNNPHSIGCKSAVYGQHSYSIHRPGKYHFYHVRPASSQHPGSQVKHSTKTFLTLCNLPNEHKFPIPPSQCGPVRASLPGLPPSLRVQRQSHDVAHAGGH
ncbi:hypothetical protein T440DRAFT_195588 [Plenodomus tracheiphilus IPT5]|uniref:Uncharacterized protein n=1 Tax=Plenodomus tracheiphilus IPT5 TaxID=1408161 RepID=A0A6A7AVR7_9PLEO|nr:hypothetical protein T440DRAFT_195588 [Plenodomus tracheiphilus IPT5]